LIANVLASMAVYENEVRGERIVAGQAAGLNLTTSLALLLCTAIAVERSVRGAKTRQFGLQTIFCLIAVIALILAFVKWENAYSAALN
jgi:hypothetical protein